MHALTLVSLTIVAQCLAGPADLSGRALHLFRQRLHPDNLESVKLNALKQAAYQYGPDAAPLLDDIMKMLASENPKIRGRAAFTLGRIGPRAKSSTDALVEMLTSDRNDSARATAAYALGLIQDCRKPVVDSLIKAMETDANASTRMEAAKALGLIQDRSKPVIDSLIKVMKTDADSSTRYYAADSLANVDDGSLVVVKTLAAVAGNDVDPDVRSAAIRGIGTIRRYPDQSIPALLEALMDTELRSEGYGVKPVSADAAEALGLIGVNTDKVVDGLTVQLENTKSDRTRIAAAVAILRIRGTGEGPAAALCSILRQTPDDNSFGKFRQVDAAEGLSHLKTPTSDVLKCLQAALLKNSPFVQASAASTLGSFGAEARSTLPTLELVLKEVDRSRKKFAEADPALVEFEEKYHDEQLEEIQSAVRQAVIAIRKADTDDGM